MIGQRIGSEGAWFDDGHGNAQRCKLPVQGAAEPFERCLSGRIVAGPDRCDLCADRRDVDDCAAAAGTHCHRATVRPPPMVGCCLVMTRSRVLGRTMPSRSLRRPRRRRSGRSPGRRDHETCVRALSIDQRSSCTPRRLARHVGAVAPQLVAGVVEAQDKVSLPSTGSLCAIMVCLRRK